MNGSTQDSGLLPTTPTIKITIAPSRIRGIKTKRSRYVQALGLASTMRMWDRVAAFRAKINEIDALIARLSA
jgi:CTP-dependent riboflavin kinase